MSQDGRRKAAVCVWCRHFPQERAPAGDDATVVLAGGDVVLAVVLEHMA